MYGYTAVRKDRTLAMGGGVVTFIQHGVNYRAINSSEELEIIIIEAWVNKTKIRIINFYNPCQKITRDMLESVCDVENSKVIVCGDFNAYNTLWGCATTDRDGYIIDEFMDDNQLVCLNDGRGTRYDVAHGVESAIDLTFVSQQLAGTCTWDVSSDNAMGSDHYPIWVKIRSQNIGFEENWISRWRMKRVNWGLYNFKTSSKLIEVMPNLSDDIEELNNIIINIIYESAEETIGKTSGAKKRKMVPWWSDECREAVKNRNKAFKIVKSNHSFDNLLEYKRAQAKAKRIIREIKRKYWRDFCSNIGTGIKINDIWGMIRKMGGIRRDFSLPVLRDNGTEAVTSREKAEMLAKSFVRIHSSQNLSSEELAIRMRTIEENKDMLGMKMVGESSLDADFTLFELKRALIGVKNTSPGRDGICYKMIEEISDVAKKCDTGFI